jgi:hypothetical protein
MLGNVLVWEIFVELIDEHSERKGLSADLCGEVGEFVFQFFCFVRHFLDFIVWVTGGNCRRGRISPRRHKDR